MNKPWPDIVARYQEYEGDDIAIQGLITLTQRISDSHLSQGLYAWTSMFDLCITQTEVKYPYNGPYLCVSPKQDGHIEFRYIDTMQTEKQWHRTVATEDAIPCLLKFLNQLCWFSTETL